MERIFKVAYYEGQERSDPFAYRQRSSGATQFFRLVSPVTQETPPYSSIELSDCSPEEAVMLVRSFGKKVRVTIEPVEEDESDEEKGASSLSPPSGEQEKEKQPPITTFDPSLLREERIWQ